MSKRITALTLLDIFTLHTGCKYMSDLHCMNAMQNKRLIHLVQSLIDENMNLKEWSDAAEYITGEQNDFSSAQDAAQAILDYCNRQQ